MRSRTDTPLLTGSFHCEASTALHLMKLDCSAGLKKTAHLSHIYIDGQLHDVQVMICGLGAHAMLELVAVQEFLVSLHQWTSIQH
uniref:Uncharacterized protein n=1 Tax=Arundo donax TaxID=35708 RepID=A0A0A9BQJ0_ARUDO